MFGIGTTELILILVIVLIFFGTGKLKNVMADLGGGVRTFKKALSEESKEVEEKDASGTIEGDTKRDSKA